MKHCIVWQPQLLNDEMRPDDMNRAATLKFTAVLCQWFMAVILVTGPMPAFGQDALDEESFDPKKKTIAELSEELSREIESLRQFESYPLPEAFESRRTFEARRDEKTIKVIKHITSLAESVLALPEDAPERETLKQLMVTGEDDIKLTLVERFNSLTQRLNESLGRQADLSGVKLMSEEAFSELLDKYRLSYLGLATEQVLVLEKLGMGDDISRENVVRILKIYGEELVGLIHIHHHALELLAARQLVDGTDSLLVQSAQFEVKRLDLAVARLSGVVAMLERMGDDTLAMRRVLIEKSGGFALSLVDAAILNVVLAETQDKLMDWLRTKGASTFFSISLFIGILILARWLSRLTSRVTERALRHSDQSISRLLKETLISMAGTVVFLIGVLVALAQVGVSVTPMIAGLGVVGFIVGFALQDTLSNFASGAMILAYRPFDTGDFISAAEVEGTVLKMNLVNTTIVTIENKVLIIPNSKIWGGVIMNMTGQRLRRTDIIYRVSYSDDVDLVQRVLEELIEADARWQSDPEPLVRLKQYSESSIDFMVRAYAERDEFWEAVWALNKSVKNRFDAEGITIPFPQREVHTTAVATA
ncbi:MAG: mechanosensitive ion channel family protein [Luminiphilus sp.]|nr:mechanosensitive ion channel family protein [Luminiphilus sp.]